MNKMLTALKERENYTTTENGALTHKSTLNKVYDMFAFGGAMRNRTLEDCVLLFKEAYEENPSLAVKCLFYLRDVLKGQGERRFFRICINVYSQGFSKDMIQYDKEWKLIKEEENVEYYNLNDMYEAFFWDNNCTYYVLSNENIEFLDKIIDDMKK